MVRVPSSFMGTDGRWVHRIRQSDLKRFRLCPELHRRHMIGDLPEVLSDWAEIGSATHVAIHAMLTGSTASQAFGAAVEYWDSVSPKIRFTDAELRSDPLGFIGDNFNVWVREVWPVTRQLEIEFVEQTFSVLVYRDAMRSIWVECTIDFVANGEITDWKTSRQSYRGSNAWKRERYDVQSTVYPWVYHITTTGEVDVSADEPLCPFAFCVLLKRREVEWLPIQRYGRDVARLRQEMLGLCRLIEAGISPWPVMPTDWHCSPRWCEAWNSCMGLHLGKDPWGMLLDEVEHPMIDNEPLEEGELQFLPKPLIS